MINPEVSINDISGPVWSGEHQADAAANALAGTRAPWAPNEVGQLAVEQAHYFIFAGNATFTLVSKKTGTRFTYRVRECDTPDYKANKARGAEEVHFVKVLTGPNNEEDYQFVGTVFNRGTYRHSRKSRLREDAPSVKVFTWFLGRLEAPEGPSVLAEQVEIYHEGRCGRCGRTLTVPESVTTGFGPECAEILGVR